MQINSARFIEELKRRGSIGETPDGIDRTAFSPQYDLAAASLCREFEAAGLTAEKDPVGNVFGCYNPGDSNKAPICIGSHLDTVKFGGLYDGNLGVSAAFECIKTMQDNGYFPKHPILAVAFNAEEGGPLGGTFGSRAAAGNQNLSAEGTEEKLAGLGLKKEDVTGAKMKCLPQCYMELHIEQGGTLEKAHLDIGIVQGIVGITRYTVTVHGQANHAGTTAMEDRRDSLVAASRLIIWIYSHACTYKKPFVATVGCIKNSPNSVNVIPGTTSFVLELRDMSKGTIDAFMEDLQKEISSITGYSITIAPYSSKGSVFLSSSVSALIEAVCRESGRHFHTMFSGAGHDAMEMAKIVPTGLIFVPSHNGISHSKDEYTKDEDLSAGAQVLLEAVLKADQTD